MYVTDRDSVILLNSTLLCGNQVFLMGGLLHLVQRGGDWAGPQPTQAPPGCTKYNSPPINGQCTSHHIAI